MGDGQVEGQASETENITSKLLIDFRTAVEELMQAIDRANSGQLENSHILLGKLLEALSEAKKSKVSIEPVLIVIGNNIRNSLQSLDKEKYNRFLACYSAIFAYVCMQPNLHRAEGDK